MAHDFDIRYDRRLTREFLAHFCEGGFASSLAKITKSGLYPLDLRTRRDAKGGSEHVTLYTGLTAVLNVHADKKGRIRLDAHSTHQKNGRFDKSWSKPRQATDWSPADWASVELYLERVIPGATESHGRTEGAVQAAVGSFRTAERLVLDREVTPSFRDTKTRTRYIEEAQTPILETLAASGLSFSGMPKKLGNECDALALDADGDLLAVEIKPLSGGSIAWVAAQALMYARLLQAWVRDDMDLPAGQTPGGVLREMATQRFELGLAPERGWDVADRPVVRPIVALQRGASDEMVRRMTAVRDVLAASPHGFPVVEIFEVSLIGELLPLNRSRTLSGGPRPLP